MTNRDNIYAAVTIGPKVVDQIRFKRVVARLIKEHKSLLPQWYTLPSDVNAFVRSGLAELRGADEREFRVMMTLAGGLPELVRERGCDLPALRVEVQLDGNGVHKLFVLTRGVTNAYAHDLPARPEHIVAGLAEGDLVESVLFWSRYVRVADRQQRGSAFL